MTVAWLFPVAVALTTAGRLRMGAVASRFTVTLPSGLVLPALSVQVPVTVCAALSAVRASGLVQAFTPLRVSCPAVVKVTSLVYQPFCPSVPLGVTVAVGAVASRFTVTVAGALVFPALSVQVMLAVWLPVSLMRGSVPVVWQFSMPLVRSSRLVVKVTSPVNQSFRPWVPPAAMVVVGAVASRLMVTLAVAVPPALVAVQVRVCPSVSSWTITVSQGALVIPLWASVAFHTTVTSPVYQPF